MTITDLKTYQLANSKWVYHINDYETEFLFNEIFIEEVYSNSKLMLSETPVIVDIGANIGLFSLYMTEKYPESKIYAYEPIPHVFQALQANLTTYAPQIHVYNYGVSDQEKNCTIYFYPGYSVLSGCYADPERDKSIIISGIKSNQINPQLTLIESMVSDRLKKCIPLQCPMITLTNIIKTNFLNKIDLLKIDVEGSELDILQGINKRDWGKIEYILMEIHGKKDLNKIIEILQSHNYHLQVKEDEKLHDANIYSLFAKREL